MKLKIIHILVLILIYNISKSQVPGYMNHKFSIGYNLAFFTVPSKLLPINMDYDIYKLKFVPVIKHEFNLACVFSRKWLMEASYMIQNNDYFFRTQNYETYKPNINTYFEPDENYNKVETKSYTIGIKYFRKNQIAPIGRYFYFGMGKSNSALSEKDTLSGLMRSDNYQNNTTTYTPYSINSISSSVSYKMICLGYGNTKAIFANIFLNTRLGLNILIGSDIHGASSADGKYVSLMIQKQAPVINLMDIRIGIGMFL